MHLRFLALITAISFAIFGSMPAHAEWHRAESDRFIIYSDSRADDLEDFAETLERFHVALELETGRTVPIPSPSSRLTIYFVGTRDDLRQLYGARNSSVGGFYIPRANGSVAFVPNPRFGSAENGRGQLGTRLRRGRGGARTIDRALRTLLHEYTHHFLIASARHAMPRWLSEGAAEYFSSAMFHDNGAVDIGLPNNSRAWEISQAAEVSLEELLDYDLYRANRGTRYDAFYGRSWLLFHYLAFEPSRRGQLQTYWRAIAGGIDSLTAARQIFGDLDALSDELQAYGLRRDMSGIRYAASNISIGEVNVAPLSEGHAAMMPVIMQSDRGVDDEKALEVVTEARRIAERYDNDAEVFAALAEAEYDAGNDDAAIAAARRAIALDPTVTNAYVQQGYAMFRKAGSAEDADAAFAAAMVPFETLNSIEPDHTQPLIYYYRSFSARGAPPPADARVALEYATQLAPFDQGLAIEVAIMKAAEGEHDIARYLLGPVAADPHGGSRASAAQSMLDQLSTVPEGRRFVFRRVESSDDAPEAGDGDDDSGDGDAADE